MKMPEIWYPYFYFLIKTDIFKVDPYSFLTAHELVSKLRDGASFKKSTRKSRETSTTASNSMERRL